MNRTKWTAWQARRVIGAGAVALAGLLPPAVQAQQTVYWRSETGSGLWWNGTSPKPWWYSSWSNEQDRPDRDWRTANDIVFNNNNQTTHDVNGNDWYYVRTLTFDSTASGARTFNRTGSAGIDMRGSGTRKIENNSTASHVFNIPISLVDGTTEFNPINGDLTFNTDVYLANNWINVYGNNGKTLYLNGVVNANSGSGGLAVKQNSTVVLTNANTYSGGTWIEKGKVQAGNQTNALGTGAVNVGTNAMLDLQHGTVNLQPHGLYLWNGLVTKSTGDSITWKGALTSYNSSTVSVTDSTLYFGGGIDISSGTLNFTNTVEAGMASGGAMTGSGTFAKNGAGVFRLYPGTHSGNISLNQGEIRQYTGTMTGSGTLTMADGTKYSSDGTSERTLTKALTINGNVGLAVNSTGGLVITNSVSLGSGTRIVTNNNQVTMSGKISSGGLTKAGSGTMILAGENDYASGTTISAGTLQIGNDGLAGSVSGNIVNNSALVWYRSDSPTYSGALSGSGTLTKQGAGTLTLSGTSSSYSGATTISAGTLLVSGSLGSSAVTVSSGTTLAGAGSAGAIASLAGTVSPGNSAGAAGTLTLTGTAALGGGTYTCDITGTGSTDCDKIAAGGAVAAASTLTINLPATAPGGFNECSSYSWTIMSGSSVNLANMSLGTKWSSSGVFGLTVAGNTIVVTHTPSVPAQPDGLSASDGSSSAQVGLSWSDVSCETGYVIWRNTANVFGSATAIRTNAAGTVTYNDTGANPGQLYYYFVTATNVTGASAASVSDSGYRRLAAPANVAATDGGATANVTVTWDAVTGASSYHVYRDEDATPAGATALGPQSSGYADTGATPGQLYYYWVVASNSTSSSTSDWSTADSGYRKLTAPASVTATENLSDKVTVTWGNVTGETGFGIWRHTADVSGSATCIGSVAGDVLTYDDTTATAGVGYYYWVRATNSTSASMSDFGLSDAGMKTLTEPTTPASVITFSSLANTSMTVGWTRGNGDYVLVVVKQGSAPADPGDSTVYNANAAFGSGDPTAAGSYVVYKGMGTSVPVTGLTAGTEYYFAVYEFNGADTPNYRTNDEPVASRYTLMAEPTTQANSIYVTGTNEVTLTGINWTDGNGSGRLVVVKAGAAVDSFPVDGAGYTANATFGSGTQIGTGNYVVHAGSGPLATLSGLSRDTAYHIRVFEFNGSGATANYLASSAPANPISLKTMAVTPDGNPTGLTVSAIGSNALTVSWTKGTTGTNTLIVIRAGGNPVDPTDLNSYTASATFGSGSDLGSGSYVVYNGTGSSVMVTNLGPGTSYTIEASSFNGSDGSENYRGTPASTSAFTLMPEPTQAASIGFSTLGSTNYTVSFAAGSGLSRLVVAKAGSAVNWLPTDATAYSGENNNFGAATDLGDGNKLVHVGTSPFTLSGLSAQTEYHVRVYEYQGTNLTLNYNTNAASGNPASRYTLSTEPSAHAVAFTATALSDTQIKLDWGAATGASGFVIVRRSGALPTGRPADGTGYSQGNAIGDGTAVFVITAAGAGSVTDSYSTAASTAYYYEIFPYADNGIPANATYNYRTDSPVPWATATTGPAEPGTSLTLTSFVPASSGSATLTWTGSGADGTIILAKSGSAVNSDPVDWSGYAASTTFGSGTQIGTGNYVVYLAAGSSGNVTVTGLSAGTTYHAAIYPYNGSGSFLNYRTASPATGSVVILPDPSAGTATADGKTLIDLAWTENGYDVMIVYKAGSASAAPTQGSVYSVGSACGGGTVIFKGNGSALEHVVASGTAHHYAFYSYSGNYYSAGLTDSEPTTSFATGEVVDTFSYTNSTTLAGLSGETGWGGAWSVGTGSFSIASGSFADQADYPAMTGNKIKTTVADSGSSTAFRALGQVYKSGRIYFSYVMNYLYEGAGKYEGLSLFYDSTEKLFVGEIAGADQQLGIDTTGSSYTLSKGSGNDYIIVGYYDWAAGQAKAKAYKIGSQSVPTDEPSSWDVTVSKASNTVGWVNSIRLAAGATSGGTPGDCTFDEVRIATNWVDLIGVVPTKPSDPSGQTATPDGSEMVRLAWTKNGTGSDVMILHKTSAISTDPTDGTGYSVGNTIDGATVIYKGSATAVEHVVVPGTTNYYQFHSYSGANYYSDGVGASATNHAYADYEQVNPFSYTNGTTLGAATAGGQGFGANAWSMDTGTWNVQTNFSTAVADSVPKFLNLSNYPAMAGNLVYCSDPGNGGNAKAQRALSSAINSGQFFIAFQMAYQYRGANKWAGVSLLNSSGSEKAFLGKGAGGNWSTFAIGDGTTPYWSGFDMGEFYSGTGSTGNVYLVVGKYDFDTDVFQANAYRILDTAEFPSTEPSSWLVSQTMAGIDNIARIQLNAGSTDGGNTIGKVFYDEIRFATNWSQLLTVTCPTWAGSNMVNGAAWTAATNVWLGDTENFQFQSYPISLGHSAAIEFDWAQNGAFSASYAMTWWQNANNNSSWTNQVQMTTAGAMTSRYVTVGSGCADVRTNNPVVMVQNLNPPTAVTAAKDSSNTNSQINLEWTRGVSGWAKDVLVVRQTAETGWSTPENGTTYNPGDLLGGSGTVVYRGNLEAFADTGLAPSTTYYYRFFSENWSYYSVTYAAASATTDAGGQTIILDGSPADWVGSPSAAINNSASSVQEFIWTDKQGEVRPEQADHPNGDLREFRVFADDTWVYFLVRMSDITDITKPYIAIGVDTRTNTGSTGQTFLGDNAGNNMIGGQYCEGDNEHFPEYQVNVHYVSAAGAPQVELFSTDRGDWHAPPTGAPNSQTNAVISAVHDTIELKVPRADLGLAGTLVGRFTVATFLNTGAWNNDGDGTLQINSDGSIDAIDAISIPPWTVTDNALQRTAWEEDISDGDIDFWFDVKFGPAGLSDNVKPSRPVLTTPTNAATTLANPTLEWQASSDSDGKITGYLLEVSTNDQFNGVSGAENGTIELRVNLDANTTNYTLSTSAEYYWWRVRARDTAGELSAATTRWFRVVGKLDADGPQPTLVYIGTNVVGYLAGDYDQRIARYGYIQDVLDSEIRDTNNIFGFVIRWDDASGVYATNQMKDADSPPNGPGGFAYNIISTDGRVSPNWDLIEIDTVTGTTNDLWGVDKPFHASNTLAAGNSDVIMTNYVRAAFNVTNYDPTIEYYLTLSAEDAYSSGGSWSEYGSWNSFVSSSSAEPYYSGWCQDGPNTVRNITTNFLIQIRVTDDDIRAPVATTNLGLENSGTNVSLVVSNAAGRLNYVVGEGQDVLYEVSDGDLTGRALWFNFNAYDEYYKGVAAGNSETYVTEGRTLTNTSFVVAGWKTNWAGFNAAASQTNDTTDAHTLLTWSFSPLADADITALWGAADPAGPVGHTNFIQLNLFDVDNDRDDDQASALTTFGRLRVFDDDSTNPVLTNLTVTGTGLAREYVLTNLVEWTFPSGAADLSPAAVAANMTAGNIVNGPPGTTLQGTSNLFMNAQFYKTATNRYLTFTLTPAAGRSFKAESISFETRVSSANGPDLVELYGTMPGGSETLWATNTIDLYDPENLMGTNWNNYLVISSGVSVAMTAAATDTVLFKLLARVADTNHLVSEQNANWYIDNLTVSGYILGPEGGTQVTDQDLARGTVTFALSAHDSHSGLYAVTNTGRAPRVDFWNVSSGSVPVTNAFLTNGLAVNGGATTATIISNTAPAADKKQIVLGSGGGALVYQARYWVDDYDVDREGDSRTATNVTTATLYDEDTARPVRGYLYGGPLGIFVNGVITKAVSSGNNREYRINDEQLQAAAATSITARVNLYDFSGWTVPALSFSNALADLISTNGWLTGKDLAANTTNRPDAALEWTFSLGQAAALFNDYEGVINEFRIVSVWDKDDDRQDGTGINIDNLELSNVRIGYVTFIDNDVGQPNIQSSWSPARSNWAIPRIYLGLPGAATRSNLLINGDTVLADTNSPAQLASLTNRVYDSQLAKVTAAAPLSVVLPLYDTGGGGQGRTIKGVQRGTALTQESVNGGYDITNSSLTIGAVAANNTANYRSDLSSGLESTRIAAQFPTSTWAFSSFSYAEVGDWLPYPAVWEDHLMTASLYDADDNRGGDQRARLDVALGTLQVFDNDTVKPSQPTNVTVNGAEFTGPLDRYTAAWTNTPEFRVSFQPAADGVKAADDLEVTGVGEHRTATSTSGIGPDLGIPLAVPAEGALANYGFELGATDWTLSGAVVTAEQSFEGTNSLKMTGATVVQTVSLCNDYHWVPRVTVLGAQYRGAGTGTLTVTGLDANGDPVSGATFHVEIAGAAGGWSNGLSAATALDSAVDQIEVELSSAAGTYWDDIRIQIELLEDGSPINEVTAVFTATEQGLTTNYLFAVDRDNNRPGDRLASSAPDDAYIPAFGIAYDITPPTEVPDVTASTEGVDDPTTQFDLEWDSGDVGPDDRNDPNHPNPLAGQDLFSPWKSYKIYYGAFDINEVPLDDYLKSPADKFIFTNFIATGAYQSWTSVTATNAITDPSASGADYLDLTNSYQGGIRLYDLDYDQDYAVIVVGLDRAGNEGPAGVTSWATNNTIRFAVPQGVLKARSMIESAFPTNNNLRTGDKSGAALYWIAAGQTNAYGQYTSVTKEYDLIYKDAASFQENTNWTWSKVGTIQTNWFTDAPGQDVGLSGDRGQMRFYRASYKDRWQRTNVLSGLPQRPLASEDVYALHNLIISEGFNYVGLHGQPFTNTFSGVFGTDTNIWPAGESAAAGSTKIEFYASGIKAVATDSYFFGLDGNWYNVTNPYTPVTHVEQSPDFFQRGFSITLPTNLVGRGYATTTASDESQPGVSIPAMVWHSILKVPTNGPAEDGSFTNIIYTGMISGRTNQPVYNLVALNLPVSTHPSNLNLIASGFVKTPAGSAPSYGDQIYTVDTSTKGVRGSTKIFCDSTGTWRFVGSQLPVNGPFFKPNDILIIISVNGGLGNHWIWTYHPTNFYQPPTRWMGQ